MQPVSTISTITEDNQPQSAGMQAWVVWGVAALFVFYQYVLQTSTSVLATPLSQEFNLSGMALSALASAYFYSYILLQVPSGIAIDRFGPRKVLLCSVPAATAMIVIYALAPTIEVAFIARLFMGASFSCALVAGMYLSAQWFSPQRFALMAGLIETLCMLGGAVGQQVLSFGVEATGWRMTLIITASFGVLLSYLTWRYVENQPKIPFKEDINNTSAHLSDEQIARVNPIKTVLTSKMSWATALFAGLLGAVIPAFAGLWGVHYLQATHHISLTTAALGTALVFLGLAIASPLWGLLSDKVGLRKPFMRYATLAAFALLGLLFFVPSVSLYYDYALLFLIGIVCAACVLAFSVAKETIPKSCQGTVIGFVNMMALGIGAWLYIPGIAFLLDLQMPQAGSLMDYQPEHYQLALSSLTIGVLLALCLLPFIKETYCKNLQQHTALQKSRRRTNSAIRGRSRRIKSIRKQSS